MTANTAILSNKYSGINGSGEVQLYFSANGNVQCTGNSQTTNVNSTNTCIAINDEIIQSMSIREAIYSTNSAGYWSISRGANTYFILGNGTGIVDLNGTGQEFEIDGVANLQVSTSGGGGFVLLKLEKQTIPQSQLLTPSWALPANVAIDLNFANNQYFSADQGVIPDGSRYLSVSRSSSGYVTHANGFMTLIGPNLPRIGVGTGLLIEEARTNLLFPSIAPSGIQNGSFGANQWLSNGNTVVTNNTGSGPDGSTTASTVTLAAGQNGGSHYLGYQITATNALYVGGFYVKGTIGQQVYIQLDQGASFGLNRTLWTFTGGWDRPSISATLSSTSYYLYLGTDDRASLGANLPAVTFQIWSGELDQGSTFLTSQIPTTSSTATRAADNVTGIGALSVVYQSAAFTQYVKNNGIEGLSASAILGASFNTGSTPGFIYNRNATTPGIWDGTTNTLTSIGSAGSYLTGAVGTVGSFGPAGQTIVANGGTEATHSEALAAVTLVQVGLSNGTLFLNGYIQRLAVWKSQLPSTQRVALSLL